MSQFCLSLCTSTLYTHSFQLFKLRLIYFNTPLCGQNLAYLHICRSFYLHILLLLFMKESLQMHPLSCLELLSLMHGTEEEYINKRAIKKQNTLISVVPDSFFNLKKKNERIIFITGTMWALLFQNVPVWRS